MILDKLFGGKTEKDADNYLRSAAERRRLNYDKVKEDADSGLCIGKAHFGKKYAIIRAKTPCLIEYTELFWVYASYGSDENVDTFMHFVALDDFDITVFVGSKENAKWIYENIKKADDKVLLGYKKEYDKIRSEHSSDLVKIKEKISEKQLSEAADVRHRTSIENIRKDTGFHDSENAAVSDNKAEFQEKARKYHEMKQKKREMRSVLVEKLIADGKEAMAEELKKYRRNAIYLRKKETPENGVPVGSSKIGGFPDLPPEIRYPVMTGYSLHKSGQRPDEDETHPTSAMHLVLQLNLDELAASGTDKEGYFPKHGMLYIFWSGEEDNKKFSRYRRNNQVYTLETFEPDSEDIYKVIYWNGDKMTLRRNVPICPFPDDNFETVRPEQMVSFEQYYEYQYNAAEEINGLEEAVGIEASEFFENCDKLLGVTGYGNAPYLSDNDAQLLQLNFREGCLWSMYWIIGKDKLLSGDFSDIALSSEMD